MSRLFFTADLHLNHGFVAETRGYTSASEHDAALIERWNAKVTKRDQVWVLGDLNMGRLVDALKTVEALNGIKHLVLGNHDEAHPLHRNGHNKQKFYLQSFATVQTAAQLRFHEQKVNLSHFPYSGDHYDRDRYEQWRLRDEGLPLLCGHVHHSWKHEGNQFNVGLDHSPNLVDHDEVQNWLWSRPI